MARLIEKMKSYLPAITSQFCLFVLLSLSPGMTDQIFGQIYSPTDPLSMWDTWLFQDKDEYHLFFLQTEVTMEILVQILLIQTLYNLAN